MSKERLAIGGLMRCCTGTWDKAIQERPDGHTDGDELPCEHCDSRMVRTEGVWRWDRPCGFGYHRPDCSEDNDEWPALV